MKMLITVDGKSYHVQVQVLDDTDAAGESIPATPGTTAQPPETSGGGAGGGAGGGGVESPIAGNVLEVLVEVGDVVAVNDTLLVLEAMKMESNVASPFAGTVTAVHVKAGDAVGAGDVLVSF